MTRLLSSLRARLLALVLLAVLPAFAVILYSGLEQRSHAAQNATNESLQIVRLAQNDYEDLIDTAHQLLIVLAQLPQVRASDPTECNTFMANLLKQYPRYGNLFAARLNGDLYCSAIPLTAPVTIADRSHFQRALQTRDFVVGDFVIGRVTGIATLPFVYPVLDGSGQMQAVVVASLDLTWLNQLATQANLPAGSSFTMIDRNGTILTRYPDAEQWVGKSGADAPIVQTILAHGGEGTAEAVGVDGVNRLYAFTSLGGGRDPSTYIYVGIPSSIAYADANRALARDLLTLGAVAMFALAAAWIGSDVFILRRVNALIGVTKRITEGDLGARTLRSYGVSELSELARAFDHMADSLEQRDISLRISEEQYRNLFNRMIDGFALHEIICDETGKPYDYRFLEINPAFEKLTNLRASDCVGKTVRQVLPGIESYWIDTYGRVALTGTPAHFENYAQELDRHYEVTAFSPKQGQFATIFVDTTDRKRAAEALRSSQEYLKSIIDSSLDMIIAVDQERRITEFNRAAVKTFGYSREEILGQDITILYANPSDRQAVGEALATQETTTREVLNRRKNGQVFPCLVSASVLRDPDGKTIGYMGISRDITEQKQAEEALRASEERFRALIERSQDAIALASPDGTILYASPGAARIVGTTPEAMMGHSTFDRIHPDDLKRAREIFDQEVQHPGSTRISQFRIQRFDGTWRSIEGIRTNMLHVPGVRAMVANYRDITERKQAELRIQHLTRLYATLSQVNQTIVHVKDQNELFETICRVAVNYGKFGMAWIGIVDRDTGQVKPTAMYGEVEEQLPFPTINFKQPPFKGGLIGSVMRSGDVVYSRDIQTDPMMQHWQNFAFAGNYHSAAAVPIRLNGEIFALLNLYASEVDFFVDEEQHNLLEEMAIDISFALDTLQMESRRAQAELNLRESEARFHSAFEFAPMGMALVAPDGHWLKVNQAVCHLIGYSFQELMGKTFQDITHPDDLETDLAYVREMLVGERQTYQMEKRYLHKQGHWVWGLLSVSLVRDPFDQPLYFVSQIQDITERKRMEHALREQITALQILTEIDREIIIATEPQAILNLVCRRATELLHVPKAILRTRLASNEPWRTTSYGLLDPASDVEEFSSTAGADGFRWNELPERGVIALNQIPAENHYMPELHAREQIHAEVIAPLRANDKMLGVFLVFDSAPRTWSTDEVELVSLLAGQVALALEKIRLFEETQCNAARAQALARTASRLNAQLDLDAVLNAVCDLVAAHLNAPASLYLANEKGDSFVLATVKGLPASYLAEHKPIPRAVYETYARQMGPVINVPDVQAVPTLADNPLYRRHNIRTIVTASLIRDSVILGGLNVYSMTEPRTFTQGELSLLQGLADQAAQAITNALLFKDAQRRLKVIESLRSVDQVIINSFDLNLMLNLILDQAIDVLQADAATVLLLSEHTNSLEFAAGCGFRSHALEHTHLRLGEGYAGRAVLERQLVHVSNLTKEPNGLAQSPLLPEEGFVAYCAVPLVAKGKSKGVLEVFHRAPFNPDQEWIGFLEAIAGQAAIAIDNAELFDALHKSNAELVRAYDATIEGWSRALDLRDKETEGHTQRVTELSEKLGRAMGISDTELVHIRRGALLHDIGKMGIPDNILLKPGPLTPEEWVEMKKHPTFAYEMLSPIEYLHSALDIPHCHHEKWDGTGYPRGLKGEQIPFAARIFAIVDVWDALRSDRPYRPAWSRERTRDYIRAEAGTHFDPKVVEAFLALEEVK